MKLLQKAVMTTTIATTVTVIGWASNALALDFSIGSNFTGSTFGDPGNDFFVPPDTMGAIGTNYFTEFLNNSYRVYDRNNGSVAQSKTALQFWTDAGVSVSGNTNDNLTDPRIIYDHDSSRWFAAYIDIVNGDSSNPNNFFLAVSSSADPTGAWKGFTIPANPSNATPTQKIFADYPTLGINASGVYLASNNFFADPTGNFANVSLLSIPKMDLLGAMPTVSNLTRFDYLDYGDRGFSLQPVVEFGGADDGKEIVISNYFDADNQLLRTDLANVKGPGSATIANAIGITVQPYSNPPEAKQPGAGSPTIDANDTRIGTNVYKVGNSLWAVHGTKQGGRAAIRWYELDATTNLVKQSGTFADANYDYYFPSIAANAFGNVVIGFSRSGTGTDGFISSYAIVGETVGGLTTFSSPTLLKQGGSIYDVGSNRWGDYSATTLDPTDPFSFWTIQEFANAQNTWSTQITQIKVNSGTAVPTPAMLPGILGLGASLWRKRRKLAQVEA
jgi:hypothetical protein